MFNRRVWATRALIVLFTVVEIFASAPTLHAHHHGAAPAALHKTASSISALDLLDQPSHPTDCLACHVAHLNIAMSLGATFAPPVERDIRSFDLPLHPAGTLRLDGQFGRAPPLA